MTGEVPEREVPPGDAAAGVADGRDRRLDPRVIQLQRIGGLIFAGVVALISFAFAISTWVAAGPTLAGLVVRLGLWLAVTGLLTWHVHRWPVLEYAHASYRVDALGIEIRRGVFWRSVVSVPRSRVQHTDVSQGPLERRFELGTLVIYTAGTDHAKVSLAGLEHGHALRIREHLLPRGDGDAV